MTESPRILPFWGRVTIVESPIDEEETTSGLVIPRSALASGAPDDGPVARRGIVQSVEFDIYHEGEPARIAAEKLTPGMVVYFRKPTRIGADLLAVEFNDVLAYES